MSNTKNIYNFYTNETGSGLNSSLSTTNCSAMRIEAITDGSATFKIYTSSSKDLDSCYSLTAIVVNLSELTINSLQSIDSSKGLVAYSIDLTGVSYVRIALISNTGKTNITGIVTN